MFKKLKFSQNSLKKKLVGILFLPVVLMSLSPSLVLAEEGVADDRAEILGFGVGDKKGNRTFDDNNDLAFRFEVSAATNADCQQGGKPLTFSEILKVDKSQLSKLCNFTQSDYYRFSKEKDVGYLVVRGQFYLDSPDELRFAPDTWTRALTLGLANTTPPQVDYLRVNNGIAGSGYFEVVHQLVDFGYSVGNDKEMVCADKIFSSIILEEEEKWKVCNFKQRKVQTDGSIRGNLDAVQGNVGNIRDDDIYYGRDLRAGIGTKVIQRGLMGEQFWFLQARDGLLKDWNLAEVNKPQKLAIWPFLWLNVGNRQVKQRLITDVAVAAAAGYSVKKAEEGYVLSQKYLVKAFEWLKGGKTEAQTAAELAKAVAAEAKELSKTDVDAFVKGAIEYGNELINRAKGLNVSAYRNSTELLDDISKATGKVAQTIKSAGGSDELVAAVSKHAAESIFGYTTKIDDVYRIAGAGEKIAEEVLPKVGIVKKTGQTLLRPLKFLAKPLSRIGGWPLTIAFALQTMLTYDKANYGIYDLKNTVAFQVYDKEADAKKDRDDNVPPPEGLTSTFTGSNTGSGPKVNKSGSPLLGFINKLIGIVLGWLQELIFTLFYWLVAPLIQAMLSIHTYTDTFAAVIYPGWEIVRNLANIFFIVAIIAIAMGTLFRVEAYQYKHLLVQLIIAALLVNFSLVIAQVVLGVADTLQSQFLPNNADVIRALARDLIVGYRSTVYDLPITSQGYFTNTITPFFFLALATGSFLVFCAIAAFLVVRIVMLWVLLLLSPLAYLAGVLPSTEKYRGEWWGYFLKYAFFTPIMAFFLNLSAIIANTYKENPVLKNISTADFGNDNVAVFVFKTASNLLLLIFLLISIKVAEEFGVYGADIAKKWTERGMFAPFAGVGWLGKRAGGYIARRYNEKTSKLVTDDHGLRGTLKKGVFAVLNPVNFFRGWEERAKEKKEWAHEVAKGAGQVVASELLTLGKEKIDWKQMAFQRIQRKMESKIREALGDDISRADSMDLQNRVLFLKDFEGQVVKGAVSRLTNNPGWGDDTNEVLFSRENIKRVRSKLAKGTEGKGLALFDAASRNYNDDGWLIGEYIKQNLDLDWLWEMKNNERIYDRDKHGHFLNKDFEKWISREDVQRGLMNIQGMTDGAKKVGHYEQMFGARKDEKIGKYIPLVDSFAAKERLRQALLAPERDMRQIKKIISEMPRTSEINSEYNKLDIRQGLRLSSPFPWLPKMQKMDEKGNATGEWFMGEVGDNFENLSAMQLAQWASLGPEHIARSAESQARIIKLMAERYLDSEGNIRLDTAREYKNLIRLNADWIDGLRNVKTTGAPYMGAVGVLDTEALIQEADLAIKVNSGDVSAKVELERMQTERKTAIEAKRKKVKKEEGVDKT